MKPRRLHKLTIFSMRCESLGALIVIRRLHGSETVVEAFVPNAFSQRLTQLPLQQEGRLRLRFSVHLGFYRVGDEALLVRAMIHLLDFLRRGSFFAGEFQALS